MNNRILLITLLMAFPLFGYAQKWEKKIAKADEAYMEGDYTKAAKRIKKFRKKVVRKLGEENPYMPGYYVRQARFNMATGILVGFEDILDKGISISEKTHGKESVEHAKNQVEIASILADYGHFKRARTNLENAYKLLLSTDNLTEDLKAEVELLLARILTGQGFYSEALALLNQNEVYFNGKAVDRETYIDDKGRLKTNRLPKEEVYERYNNYATLLTLKANALRHRGDFHSADSAFIQAELWIDKYMGKDAEAYVRNQFYNAKLFEENGMEELPNHLQYDKLLGYLKRKHNESHMLAFELYESQLKEYLRNDKSGRFNNLAKEYERAIKKNFSRHSLNNIILETIDFEERLNDQKTKNLYADATTILSSKGTLPKYHTKTAEIHDYLYKISVLNKDFHIAERNLSKILEIKKELYGEEAPLYHLSKILYANYLIDHTDKLEEAGKIYEESFNGIIKKQVNFRHKDYLEILNHLAKYYELTDQYKKSSAVLAEYSEAAGLKYNATDYEYGIALEKNANLRIKVGEYEEAEKEIEKALTILEEFRREDALVIHLAEALDTKAQLLAIKGYFDEAEDLISRSEKLVRKSDLIVQKDLVGQEELASLYIKLGQFRDAQEILDEVINEYGTLYGPNSSRLIRPLNSAARLKLIYGLYPESETLAKRAESIAEKNFGRKSTKIAGTLKILSELYTTLGDYEKAEGLILEAISVQQTQFDKDHLDVARSLTQHGLIKFYKGDDLKETEKIMLMAQDAIVKKLGNRNPFYAELQNEIAKVYISQQRFNEAFIALETAEIIWEGKAGRKRNINLASIYVLKGDIFYQQRNYEKAEDEFGSASKLYKRFFHKDHPEYVKVMSKLSKLYYMQGDYRKSIKYIEDALESYSIYIRDYFPALSEREKAKFWNTIQPDYEFYNTLAFNSKDEFSDMIGKVYNNSLQTKALLLNSAIKTREAILSSNDEELKALFIQWLEKKEFLTSVLSMNEQQLLENSINPVQLHRELEELEKELGKRSDIFSKSFDEEAIDWKMINKTLKDHEVAVEMVRYRYFDHNLTDSVIYAVMYLSGAKRSKPEVVLLSNGKDLEQKYFKYYKNSIIYRIPDPYSYKNYWKPIEEKIGSHSTIYLSADGVFNQINLETIPLGEEKYVLDNSNIILVSNTKDIYHHSNTKTVVQNDNNALMFGNPDYYLTASASNKINPLPGTEKEIISLQEMLIEQGWTIDYYLENDAREEQVKKLKNPKIFHVATHGFYTPKEEETELEKLTRKESDAGENPLLRTGLLLTGAGDLLDKTSNNYNMDSGILTAYEAMNLNLDKTDLVVLSACETGLGDLTVGEGVYGLQRAFLVAGAKTLIMSMFKVDDRATQELMTTFYKKWLETGNKRTSFIEAKKEIRNKYKDPIFWGAFIMIGLE